jgi:hypothetical protein
MNHKCLVAVTSVLTAGLVSRRWCTTGGQPTLPVPVRVFVMGDKAGKQSSVKKKDRTMSGKR